MPTETSCTQSMLYGQPAGRRAGKSPGRENGAAIRMRASSGKVSGTPRGICVTSMPATPPAMAAVNGSGNWLKTRSAVILPPRKPHDPPR